MQNLAWARISLRNMCKALGASHIIQPHSKELKHLGILSTKALQGSFSSWGRVWKNIVGDSSHLGVCLDIFLSRKTEQGSSNTWGVSKHVLHCNTVLPRNREKGLYLKSWLHTPNVACTCIILPRICLMLPGHAKSCLGKNIA